MKLAKKLAKHEICATSEEDMAAEINNFLTPTLSSIDPVKPTLTQHYALTFNTVDRLNKLIGYINYLPRQDEDFLLLASLVQIAIVQTWALIDDWEYDSRGLEEQGFDLQEFAADLAKELLV